MKIWASKTRLLWAPMRERPKAERLTSEMFLLG